MLSTHHGLIVFTAASLTLAACSSKPERTDAPAVETQPATGVAAEESGPAPLEYLESAPEATKLSGAGGVTAYKIGEMTLLHKRTEANPVVAARLYIEGGQRDLTESTAGIQQLAMRVAVVGGTESTPKDEFNARLDSTGSAVWSFTDRDFSGYGLKTLVGTFDDTWSLFEQAVLEPVMPPDEVEVRRSKHLAEISSLMETPDSQLSYVGAKYLFQGHPYHNLQIGTKENVSSFGRDDLLAYQRGMLDPKDMLFVVVGNVAAEDVIAKIRERFGRLAVDASETEAGPLPPLSSEPGVEVAQRALPTNYILGFFPAPKPGHADYPAMLVAMDYLGDRLFEEVRTKRNLTYAVSAGMSDAATNYGYLYVTAADPQTTLPVMFDEVAKLKSDPLTPEMLEQTVNVFITNYYMGLETNGSQADLLANAELIGGDWQLGESLLEQIRAVKVEDVQRVANEYLGNYRFAVVGKSDLPTEIFQVK